MGILVRDVKRAIKPLRLIFWGGIICLFISCSVIFHGKLQIVPSHSDRQCGLACLRVFYDVEEQLAYNSIHDDPRSIIQLVRPVIGLEMETDAVPRFELLSEPLQGRFEPKFVEDGGA